MKLDVERVIRRYLMPDNEYALKFYGMGFQLGRCTLEKDHLNTVKGGPVYWQMRTEFKCVCGRTEILGSNYPQEVFDFEPCVVNFFRDLERAGSMDRDHLIKDGYTTVQIDQMEERARVMQEAAMMEVYRQYPKGVDDAEFRLRIGHPRRVW